MKIDLSKARELMEREYEGPHTDEAYLDLDELVEEIWLIQEGLREGLSPTMKADQERVRASTRRRAGL